MEARAPRPCVFRSQTRGAGTGLFPARIQTRRNYELTILIFERPSLSVLPCSDIQSEGTHAL